MRAVAVAVLTAHAAEQVEGQRIVHVVRPAAEVRMRRPDPRVDDIDVHAFTRRGVVVGCGERKHLLVDAVESPWIAVLVHRLGLVSAVHLVPLDKGDERIARQRLRCHVRQFGGEALERARIREAQRAAIRAHELRRKPGGVGHGRPEDDDVFAWNDVVLRSRKTGRRACDVSASQRARERYHGQRGNIPSHENSPREGCLE